MKVLRFTKNKNSELLLNDVLRGIEYDFLNNRCLDHFTYSMCNNGYNVFEIEPTDKNTFNKLVSYCKNKNYQFLISKFNDSILITGLYIKSKEVI